MPPWWPDKRSGRSVKAAPYLLLLKRSDFYVVGTEGMEEPERRADEKGHADERAELQAEVQNLRAQVHSLRLAIEQAARLIWIKPTEAEKILSNALN